MQLLLFFVIKDDLYGRLFYVYSSSSFLHTTYNPAADNIAVATIGIILASPVSGSSICSSFGSSVGGVTGGSTGVCPLVKFSNITSTLTNFLPDIPPTTVPV
jgi:hypothetical protein